MKFDSFSVRIFISRVIEANSAANTLKRYLLERNCGNVSIGECLQEADLTIRLCYPEEFPELPCTGTERDGFAIQTLESQNTVVLLAKTAPGFFAAVGAFLREVRIYADGRMEIPEFCLQSEPDMDYRASLLSLHIQDNGYKNWSLQQFKEYTEDMALWGANYGMYLLLQFGQRSRKTFEEGTEEAKNWETIRQIPEMIDQLGLKVGVFCGHNDIFVEDVKELKVATDGAGDVVFISSEASACPSYPGVREKILQQRRELFRKVARLDALYLPMSDYGGCACEKCRPYVNTYLSVCKDIAACLREYHPQAKVYVSTQMVTREGMLEYMIPYMTGEESGWIDGIVYGVHGAALTLPELQERLPAGRFEILLYPEITMADNWGRIGAVPWIERLAYSIERQFDVATYCNEAKGWRADGSLPLDPSLPAGYDPDTMYDKVNGAFTYSEGLHDDIAKYVWLRYCWDPCGDRQEFAKEYCRMYFGEETVATAVDILNRMEKISERRIQEGYNSTLITNDDGTGKEKSRAVRELVESMKRQVPSWVKEGWRFKMLELRARIDELAFRAIDETIVLEEKNEIVALAEDIFRQSGHISLVPKGTPWQKEKALEKLNELLSVPEKIQGVAPIAPKTE